MRTLFFSVIIFLFIISFLYESYPLKYYDIVRKKSELFDPLLIISVMYVESNFKEDAVSPKGAIGLMQIMPATADWISKKYKIDGDMNDPEDNITYGITYLEYLFEKFGEIDKALMAYNVGPFHVEKLKEAGRRYLRKVKKTYFIYKLLYRYLGSD